LNEWNTEADGKVDQDCAPFVGLGQGNCLARRDLIQAAVDAQRSGGDRD
jgi:hypothetical protein